MTDKQVEDITGAIAFIVLMICCASVFICAMIYGS